MNATEESLRRNAWAPDVPATPAGVSEAAEARLRSCPYLALRAVNCAYSRGVLTLRGRLPSYHLKQVALASVAGLPGVERVLSEIQVSAEARGLVDPGAAEADFIRMP